MSIPKTIIDKAEAFNKADEQDRENIKPKQPSGTILGLESFEDTAFQDEFNKSDKVIADDTEATRDTIANNREMFATHRDYNYGTSNRRQLYLTGMKKKRLVTFIGTVVAARSASVNAPQ